MRLFYSREYRTYLQSHAWQIKRRARLEHDHYRCRNCFSRDRLEVNHWSYANLGVEPLEDLVTLCHLCHVALTQRARSQRSVWYALWYLACPVRWLVLVALLLIPLLGFLIRGVRW